MSAMAQALAQANAGAVNQQNIHGAADENGMNHFIWNNLICFRCGRRGHVSTRCEKPMKESKTAPTTARIFSLDGKRRRPTKIILFS
ncbi:hypothetical protein TSUD_188950 [Trifolium subterraneum]|uniref:CCHC-type domain-containing protein n=1 Tax=Trifolium subterraneum TaxID=3900 RepID=A0A2Z6NUF6_TRISU|nr:hypothetical protein TSUD_188950 [Trifolium subterraneum]